MNKYNVEKNIIRQKTRLVTKGYSQALDKDYEETYIAVVRLEPLRMLIAVTM